LGRPGSSRRLAVGDRQAPGCRDGVAARPRRRPRRDRRQGDREEDREGTLIVVRALAALTAAAVVVLAVGCGPPPSLTLPSGPSTTLADAQAVLHDALGHCAGLHSITAELGLSGRAGSTKLRGRLQAGFAEPSQLRLEAVAPFGAPFFVVAGSA